MTQEELFAVLRLQRVPNLGNVSIKKLIAACGSAQAVFEEKKRTLLAINGVGKSVLRNLQLPKAGVLAEKELKNIAAADTKYCYLFAGEYPKLLRECVDAPVLFFHKGNIIWDRPRILSIVGTRNSSSYGRDFCEGLIADIAHLQPTIVSGYAYGIDICAHKAAIYHNLQTLACMGHGLPFTYPFHHKSYNDKMMVNGGFVSEFWSDVEVEKEHFVMRNRIIAGLSHATVVIESGASGGSLITANLAFDYQRELFAVPGRTIDPGSIGCNQLIRDMKAAIITSAEDLIRYLQWEENPSSKIAIQPSLFVDLEGDEKKVFEFLKTQEKEVLDSIALVCEIPVFKVASILLNLELKGLVKPLPGKWFEAIY
ncbi:MAG: DNA-protecting protein DprA [Flavobacteriaceae bacterium]|nr:DNA-protecting protein DprA [Flavobacteriaceae bacterium]